MVLIRTKPNKERIKSILKTIKLLEERLSIQNPLKYTSLIVTDYYEIIKELTTVILLINGYKSLNHKELIDFLEDNYKELNKEGVKTIHRLRILRHKINYEGTEIDIRYLTRNEENFKKIINKLKTIINKSLS